MTSTAISQFPAIVGKAVLYSSWGMIRWVFAKIAIYPLISAISIVMSFGFLIGGNNALFLQQQAHPSPFFMSSHQTNMQVMPIERPVNLAVAAKEIETNNSISVEKLVTAPIPATSKAVQKIGHAQIILLQQKLAKFGFFEGKADGFYGPQTASAIRAFEKKHGINIVGAITPQIYEAIVNDNNAINSVIIPKPVIQNIEEQILPETVLVVKQGNNELNEDPLMQIVRNAASNNSETQVVKVQIVDKEMVKKVQKALASLGFLYGRADGVAGQSTARAIREFEVFHNYKVSGEVTPELLDMLIGAGASV